MIRSTCPVCGGGDLLSCLDRAEVPVLQNRLYPTAEAARAAVRGRLLLMVCRACGFGFNAAFDPDRAIYDATYENDQSVSGIFSAHVDARADRILATGERLAVVEVGCGQGYFLERLASRGGGRLRLGLGFDPAYRGDGGRPPLAFLPRIFTEADAGFVRDRAGGPVDVVVSRHTIEHVPDPVGFLTVIRRGLATQPDVRLFLETPDVGWILENRVVQDCFYEHCNYFSPDSLAETMRRAGFVADRMDAVFGGQYLWAEGRPDRAEAGIGRAPTALLDQVAGFAAATVQATQDWRRRLAELGAERPVALWGAGAKGVTFATMIDPEADLIDCLIDVNPKKQGQAVPLTGHPVLAPADAAARGVGTVVIMNPNYRAEIAGAVASLGLTFDLIDC